MSKKKVVSKSKTQEKSKKRARSKSKKGARSKKQKTGNDDNVRSQKKQKPTMRKVGKRNRLVRTLRREKRNGRKDPHEHAAEHYAQSSMDTDTDLLLYTVTYYHTTRQH